MTHTDCVFYEPKELGKTRNCVVFGFCNLDGVKCVAFHAHTDESRKELAEAIESRKKGTEK